MTGTQQTSQPPWALHFQTIAELSAWSGIEGWSQTVQVNITQFESKGQCHSWKKTKQKKHSQHELRLFWPSLSQVTYLYSASFEKKNQCSVVSPTKTDLWVNAENHIHASGSHKNILQVCCWTHITKAVVIKMLKCKWIADKYPKNTQSFITSWSVMIPSLSFMTHRLTVETWLQGR